MRQQSKNEFEKNFYKLMNNAVFGKCMENVRKFREVKLVTSWKGQWGARALISKPNFHSSIIFDDMAIIELEKLDVIMNKPIYIGFAILDISKLYLYNFHYNYILHNFHLNDVKLLYTDTDSLIYQFNIPDIYSYIKRDCNNYFDTSDYPSPNIWGIPPVNKKVLGLMNDENSGKIMTEFVGLRAKMYSFKIDGEDVKKSTVKKSKGVVGSTLKTVTFADYKNCLFNKTIMYRKQKFIKSEQHQVFSIKQKKEVLNPNDDKRKLIPETTDTLPWSFNEESNADEMFIDC